MGGRESSAQVSRSVQSCCLASCPEARLPLHRTTASTRRFSICSTKHRSNLRTNFHRLNRLLCCFSLGPVVTLAFLRFCTPPLAPLAAFDDAKTPCAAALLLGAS